MGVPVIVGLNLPGCGSDGVGTATNALPQVGDFEEFYSVRLRASDLQRMEWTLLETRLIPDWCGCSVAYLPVLAGDGWVLAPIWDPERTPIPLRRWEPAVPFWAADP